MQLYYEDYNILLKICRGSLFQHHVTNTYFQISGIFAIDIKKLLMHKGQGSRSTIIGPVNSQKNQIVCKTYLWSI